MVTRRLTMAGFAALVGLIAVRPVDAHPLHTTLSELTVAPDGTVQIVLRAFVDDFAAAVTRVPSRPGAIPTPPDSAIARYLGQTVVLTDAASRRVALAVTGTRRTGDLLWVTLRAPVRASGGVSLTNRVLFERWDDQVNIVQATLGASRQTLLFTRRDGVTAKAIRPVALSFRAPS